MGRRTYTYDGTDWVGLTSTTADLSNYANMTTTPISGFRNAIINGDFRVWQRGTSFSNPSNGYTADRWLGSSATAGVLSRQLTNDTTTGIQYALRYQRTAGQTSTSNLAISQSFETVSSIPFAGKTVTLSFYARKGADASANLSATVKSGTGTDQNMYTVGYTGVATVVTGTPTLTTSWQRFTYTGTVPANATEVGIQFDYVPTGTAGTNDYYEVTGIQLEQGTIATPFEQRPIGTELALCQRYFYKIENQELNVYNQYWNVGLGSGGQALFSRGSHPVTMRTTPVVTNSINGTSNTTHTFNYASYNTGEISRNLIATTQTPNKINLNYSSTDNGGSTLPVGYTWGYNTAPIYVNGEL